MVYDGYLTELRKRNIAPMYIMFGDEDFLMSKVVSAIGKVLFRGQGADFNFDYLDGDVVTIEELAGMVETMPFNAPRRLVVVKNSPYFFSGKGGAKKEVRERLISLLEGLPKTTCLIFMVRGKVDQRQKAVRFVKSKGRLWEFPYLRGKPLANWIVSSVSQKGSKIDPGTSYYLAEIWRGGLSLLDGQLEKLAAYTGPGGEIKKEHIQLLVDVGDGENIFQLLDAVGRGQVKGALLLLDQMLAAGEAPLLLLFLIAQRLRLLGKVKSLQVQGFSHQEIVSRTKQHPYTIKRAIQQGESFSYPALQLSLKECLWADQQLKGGPLEPRLVLEMLLIKIAQSTTHH